MPPISLSSDSGVVFFLSFFIKKKEKRLKMLAPNKKTLGRNSEATISRDSPDHSFMKMCVCIK